LLKDILIKGMLAKEPAKYKDYMLVILYKVDCPLLLLLKFPKTLFFIDNSLIEYLSKSF
jgi:hypothetical protein